MRYTKYKWMMWLVLLCFSCVNEEQRAALSDEPGKVRMNMSISTRATYDPEVLNENETRINRLRLYVFDGSTLDKMYYWSDLNINNGNLRIIYHIYTPFPEHKKNTIILLYHQNILLL